ncbi:ABC transporter ATP-binding protein [bacterium]|nr:ABC transporter ATP-binding protein [bacterium]
MVFPAASGSARTVLDGVDLSLHAGQCLALVGRSGSGKTTLLHLAAGIAVPTSGRVLIDGEDLGGMTENARTRLRRDRIGIVFQFFHLLPHLNVAENVALPGWIDGRPGGGLEKRVGELLDRVGLADRSRDPVGRLSGGEMQRVALCRALLNKPSLLLADEPTGSLDDRTGQVILDLLLEMAEAERCALLLVTHSLTVAARAERIFELHDGRLRQDPGVPS